MEQRNIILNGFNLLSRPAKERLPIRKARLTWFGPNQLKARERHPAELLRWFKEADRDYGDGASYPKYTDQYPQGRHCRVIRAGSFCAWEFWRDDTGGLAAFKLTRDRQFIKQWKMTDLEPLLAGYRMIATSLAEKPLSTMPNCLLCTALATKEARLARTHRRFQQIQPPRPARIHDQAVQSHSPNNTRMRY